MDNDKTVTIDQVRAACDTVLEVIARECDARAAEAAYWFAEDVMTILRGEWVAETAVAPAEDALDQLPF